MKYDISVFGGCSLDKMYYQNIDGSYNDEAELDIPGGKGSNQAVAASRAGAKVAMISKIGNDLIGKEILNNLIKNNVNTDAIEIENNLNNDTSKIFIERNEKDNKIVRSSGAIDNFTIDMIDKNKNLLLNSKMVLGQMKAPIHVMERLINFCYDNNIPLIITPCRPNKLNVSDKKNIELIDKITFITANRTECEAIFNTKDIKSCVEKYPNKLIVTLGAEGVMYSDGEKVIHLKAINVNNVVDTVGAGDTFNGNLAYGLINKFTLKDAIVRAQFASAMKIQIKTAQKGMPYYEQLNEYIRNYNTNNFKYKKEFDLCYKAIMNAYELLSNNFKIKRKSDKSFVTESDLIVESYIINEIKKIFPNDNIVSEESNNSNSIINRTWIIDPIDGTEHYMKNSKFWGIQVGFVDDYNQFSIIYLPKLNEIYYSIKNVGVFLNESKIELNKETPKLIIEFAGSLEKKLDEKIKIFNYIREYNNKAVGYMHINACCVAFANLLSGRNDAIISSVKRDWDIMPGKIMLEEANVFIKEIDGLTIYSRDKDFFDYLISKY